MKKNIAIIVALISSIQFFGQNYRTEFLEYIETNDTIKQVEVLKKWEIASPNDPELFVSYFNYYFLKGNKEVLTVSTKEPKEDGFILKDSLNNTAGYLASEIYLDNSIIQKGIDKISEGIKLFPNRLDMRYGKIYTLGQIEDWDKFTSEIIKTIEYSKINNNHWTWTNNESVEDSENFFLTGLQDYQMQLYDSGKDELLLNMRNISESILKIYPNHIPSLSNISITYLLTGEFDRAIETLLKAEKIDESDYIILANIAHGYKLKGDIKKAIAYYEKVIIFGDEETKEFARNQINDLSKE
ncbi:tetratricopeptide repeat protein [Lutibacter sp. HS1-25]|uniref:tetratricopeptide repeat protein n=1 Tax=Lutibacter sp. HS1-25 TaxID=2485000 RepID=UPI00101253ED|nr:tetratricopeptide repeat protein [Lutibacter sp. HS1-25]RXP47870.1 tetratricopeptide repeat protein [Lutibacter sp. HS1-25]RXP48853.1 tetratricopeptide repeat protein [Lutibacter sp. HS1-25]